MKNGIVLHGYLGKRPELKDYQKPNGEIGKRAQFSLGVGRTIGDTTDWFDCVVFGKRAEVIEKWTDKGSQLVVTGRMESSISDKDGVKRKFWNVVVTDFDFCDSKNSARGSNQPAANDCPAIDDLPDSWQQADADNPFE